MTDRSSNSSQGIPGRMAQSRWSLADRIDFELLVEEDLHLERSDPQGLHKRDRSHFKAILAEGSISDHRDRPSIFRAWLDRRRRERFDLEARPGESVISAGRWIFLALLLVGFLLAFGAVRAFIPLFASQSAQTASGHVNVILFFGAFVLIPFLFTIYGLAVLLFQCVLPKAPPVPIFLKPVLKKVVKPALQRVWERSTADSLPSGIASGSAGKLLTRPGSVLSRFAARLLFSQSQALGLGITLGVSCSSVLFILFVSRPYGWETTLAETITPRLVHATVSTLATPWAAIFEAELGFPTFEQVQATQYFPDLAGTQPQPQPRAWGAWAVFLTMSSVFYGLFPKLVLYGLTRALVLRALAPPLFHDLRYESLWERLTVPAIEVEASHETDPAADPVIDTVDEPEAAWSEDQGSTIVLVPNDYYNEQRHEEIASWLQRNRHLGPDRIRVLPSVRAPSHADSVARTLETIEAQSREIPAPSRILYVEESRMPPMRESLAFLTRLRSQVPGDIGIEVFLMGSASPSKPLGEPVPEIELRVWSQKIRGLQLPNMRTVAANLDGQPAG